MTKWHTTVCRLVVAQFRAMSLLFSCCSSADEYQGLFFMRSPHSSSVVMTTKIKLQGFDHPHPWLASETTPAGSFRVDEKFTTALMKKPDVRRMRARPLLGALRRRKPQSPSICIRRSYDDSARRKSRNAQSWLLRKKVGLTAESRWCHFLIAPGRKVVVFQS